MRYPFMRTSPIPLELPAILIYNLVTGRRVVHLTRAVYHFHHDMMVKGDSHNWTKQKSHVFCGVGFISGGPDGL
jgi:hypothetical protein